MFDRPDPVIIQQPVPPAVMPEMPDAPSQVPMFGGQSPRRPQGKRTGNQGFSGTILGGIAQRPNTAQKTLLGA